ncbi:hypothetical protein Pelo_2557 [Pelomyxa schiedti]|nr:hypothetical protein Pelo_2557 [Pelomyxa schiedti]
MVEPDGDEDEAGNAVEVVLPQYAPPEKRFITEEEISRLKDERAEQGYLRETPYDPECGKPLYERLKENREREELEFSKRFALPTPKALDEDEVKFLDNLEMEYKQRRDLFESEVEKELKVFKEQQAGLVLRQLPVSTPPPEAPQTPTALASSTTDTDKLLPLLRLTPVPKIPTEPIAKKPRSTTNSSTAPNSIPNSTPTSSTSSSTPTTTKPTQTNTKKPTTKKPKTKSTPTKGKKKRTHKPAPTTPDDRQKLTSTATTNALQSLVAGYSSD